MNNDYMISFQNETKQTIEASYKKMTAVERLSLIHISEPTRH